MRRGRLFISNQCEGYALTETYTKIIQYRVRKDAVAKNADRVRALVAEIEAVQPEGLGYLAFQLDDGAFLHIAFVRALGARDALHDLPAFQAWATALADIRLGEMVFTDCGLIGVSGRNALTPNDGVLDTLEAL